MFRNEFLRGSGQPVDMAPEKFPESPSDVGQPEIKRNPALFALTLSEHAGFDALAARTMTPPPRYTRVAQPRLTLQIPEEVQQDEEVTSSSSIESPRETITTESVPASPVVASPSKQPENKLFFKVKAEVKRRGKGIRSRLKKSTSLSGSTSTTPFQGSPASPSGPSDATFAYSTSNDASPHSPASPHNLSVVHELDSRQINNISTATSQVQPTNNGGFLSQFFSRSSDADQSVRRTPSVSSIIPTPKRGLSIAAPQGHRPPNANLNPTELTGRLESLSEQESNPEDTIVSPCSPASPASQMSFGRWSLMRSNAVIDRMYEMPDPISPLQALPGASPPPSSPTLDGRLERLPRLNVPSVSQSQNRHLNSLRSQLQGPIPAPRQFAELDYGKELVGAGPSEPEVLGGWYTSPTVSDHNDHRSIPRVTIDHAENAPEVVLNQQPQPSHSFSSIGPNSQSIPLQRYTGRPFQPNSPLAALTGSIWDSLLSGIIKATELLRESYGPDPPVPANHVRVRWKCVCYLLLASQSDRTS
jgi:hypothetical protein